jgi:hypothetical protein
MNRMDAISWILSVCAGCLRLSQLKTLSQLSAAAMNCRRISLSEIGRALGGGWPKHQIKKAWRFCANDRIEVADAMEGVVARLLRRRKKRLLIAFDWTDIRGFQVLVASAVLKGRSIPLAWSSVHKHQFDKSQNAFEESLLLVLRKMIPRSVRVILLADRGFGRTEMARFCQRQGFHYIIRINPDVHVRCASYIGKLNNYPCRKGVCKLLRSVAYRSDQAVTQNIVVRWVRKLPKHRDECWFLMSDLANGPARLSQLYGRRMAIEEMFRDLKNKRNGWSLRDTQLTKPARLDRLLLILALAYILLCGIGLHAIAKRPAKQWSASPRNNCSVFTVGHLMIAKIGITPEIAFHALCRAVNDALGNWG